MIKRPAVMALAMLVSACAAPPVEPGNMASVCANKVLAAANYTSAVAEARTKRMEVMRFGSQESMEAYIAETEALQMEAIGLDVLLTKLGGRYGRDFELETYEFDDATQEEVAPRIASAKACAADLLK